MTQRFDAIVVGAGVSLGHAGSAFRFVAEELTHAHADFAVFQALAAPALAIVQAAATHLGQFLAVGSFGRVFGRRRHFRVVAASNPSRLREPRGGLESLP